MTAKAARAEVKAPAQSRPPRSWELKTWPAEIWPHSHSKGVWVSRAYRKELIAAGAISRVGNKLVFIGAKYETWLERRGQYVEDFVPRNPDFGKQRADARRSQDA